jgi:hypothetical protein
MYLLTIRILLTTRVYSHLTAQLILLLVHAAAEYRSQLQGNTSVTSMNSLLHTLSNMSGEILILISVITLTCTVIKIVLNV